MWGGVFVYPAGAVVGQASGVLVDEEAERNKEVGTLYDSIWGTASAEWVRSLVSYIRQPESAAVSLPGWIAVPRPARTQILVVRLETRDWLDSSDLQHEPARSQILCVQLQTEPAVPLRNQAALRLLEEWLSEQSDYDEKTWPEIRKALDEDRLGVRSLFSE